MSLFEPGPEYVARCARALLGRHNCSSTVEIELDLLTKLSASERYNSEEMAGQFLEFFGHTVLAANQVPEQ